MSQSHLLQSQFMLDQLQLHLLMKGEIQLLLQLQDESITIVYLVYSPLKMLMVFHPLN